MGEHWPYVSLLITDPEFQEVEGVPDAHGARGYGEEGMHEQTNTAKY